MSFPFEFEIFGRRIHELESLTIGGGKSLSNLVEIFCALAIGVVGCLVMCIRARINTSNKSRGIVRLAYSSSLLMYFLMPVLPE